MQVLNSDFNLTSLTAYLFCVSKTECTEERKQVNLSLGVKKGLTSIFNKDELTLRAGAGAETVVQ